MKTIIRIGILKIGFVASCLLAQAPAIPAPPYLKPTPPMTSWAVFYQSGPIKQVNVIRTKNLRVVVLLHSSGKREELWSDGATHISSSDSGLSTTKFFLGPQTLMEEYQTGDFPDFSWVSRENYIGTVELDKRPCLVFQTKGVKRHGFDFDPETMEPLKPAKPSGPLLTAWIDEATRLPVQFAIESEIQKVVFGNPPKALLNIPGPVAELFQQMNQVNQISTVRAPRGG